MKVKLAVATLLEAALFTAPSVWAHTYSNADFNGTYVEKFSGFFSSVASPLLVGTSEPQSGAGFVIANGDGTFSGALAFSIGGNTCVGDIAGTYTVFSSGTGTSNGTFTPLSVIPGMPSSNYSCPSLTSGAQDEAFVIVSPTEIDFISTDSDSVVSGTAVLQTQGSQSSSVRSSPAKNLH